MDSQSKNGVQAYNKKDLVFALCVFVLCVVMQFVTIVLEVSPRTTLYWVLTWFPVILAMLIFTFLRHRSFASIGIHRRKWGHSLLVGLIFSLIPVGSMIILGLVMGWEFSTPEYMLFALLNVIVFAATEDILFVGFIQTRLSGFFKSDRTAIYIGSAMFALAHLPSRIMAGTIDETIITYMVMWFFMHQVFVWVFRRHNAIYATIVLHTFINFAPRMWVWVIPYDTRVPVGVWPHFVILVLFILTRVWESRIKKRDAVMNKSDNT